MLKEVEEGSVESRDAYNLIGGALKKIGKEVTFNFYSSFKLLHLNRGMSTIKQKFLTNQKDLTGVPKSVSPNKRTTPTLSKRSSPKFPN